MNNAIYGLIPGLIEPYNIPILIIYVIYTDSYYYQNNLSKIVVVFVLKIIHSNIMSY